MYNLVEQLIKAGERIRTSEAFAADYKSAPFVHFGTPAFKDLGSSKHYPACGNPYQGYRST